MDQAKIDEISVQLQKRIADKSLELPMLPHVTSQVLAIVNDEDSDAMALSQLIQSDQALAGHVMRIANSAAYSPTAQMSSLQQATARLGMQNISEIAMAATMGPKMFKTDGFEDLIKELWNVSLATGVWARELARQGRRNVESTFLCGLLSQIGRPVVLQTVLDICNGKAIDRDTLDELMKKFQLEVGSMLSEYWKLPVAVGHTIAGVGGGEIAGSEEIVNTVIAAGVFAAVTTGDRNYDVDVLSSDAKVMEVNLYPEDVEVLLDKADAVHETIGALSL